MSRCVARARSSWHRTASLNGPAQSQQIRLFLMTNFQQVDGGKGDYAWRVPLDLLEDSFDSIGGFPFEAGERTFERPTLFIKGAKVRPARCPLTPRPSPLAESLYQVRTTRHMLVGAGSPPDSRRTEKVAREFFPRMELEVLDTAHWGAPHTLTSRGADGAPSAQREATRVPAAGYRLHFTVAGTAWTPICRRMVTERDTRRGSMTEDGSRKRSDLDPRPFAVERCRGGSLDGILVGRGVRPARSGGSGRRPARRAGWLGDLGERIELGRLGERRPAGATEGGDGGRRAAEGEAEIVSKGGVRGAPDVAGEGLASVSGLEAPAIDLARLDGRAGRARGHGSRSAGGLRWDFVMLVGELVFLQSSRSKAAAATSGARAFQFGHALAQLALTAVVGKEQQGLVVGYG